jgi:hypothetical protein
MATQTDGTGWTLLFTQAADAWMENCKAISGGSQTFAHHWLKTCSDQVRSNLDAWTKLTGCQDPAEVAQIQQRWWQDAVERIGAEFKDCQDQMTSLSQQTFSAFQTKPAHRGRSHSAAAE